MPSNVNAFKIMQINQMQVYVPIHKSWSHQYNIQGFHGTWKILKIGENDCSFSSHGNVMEFKNHKRNMEK